MKSFKTEIYTLDVLRLSAIYGERLKYGTIEGDTILNLDGDVCYKSGERARVLEINGDDYILESEGKFILTKEELIASQIKNLENSMKRTMEHDLIAQGYTQDEVKRIISSRSQKKAIKNSFGYELWLEGNMLTSDDGFADEDEAMEEAKAEAQSRLEEWQSEGHSEDYTVDDFDIEITEEDDDDDDDDLFNACGKKKGKKKAIKSELEEPTEDEEVHMNTAADRQWAEEKKLANARRTRKPITNANYDGIKAQMEYTLESCRDFAEDHCDGWDGSDAQAVKCVLDDVVRVKGRNGRIRGNIQEAIADWLMGLPMNIAFENYKILQLGEQWGYLPKVDYNSGDYTSKESKWVDNWFMGIANNILKLARKFKVETPMPSYR